MKTKYRFIDALRGIAILGVLIVHTGQVHFSRVHKAQYSPGTAADATGPATDAGAPEESVVQSTAGLGKTTPTIARRAPRLRRMHVGDSDLADQITEFTRTGARGVQLFFLVSALTLFLSQDRRKLVERHPTINFFIRRIARIAPMFWTALIFFLRYGLHPTLDVEWLGEGRRLTAWAIAATTTFVNGWNPYWIQAIVPGGWSVAVEAMFYMILPMLYRAVRSLRASLLLLAAAVLLAIGFHLLAYWRPLIPEKTLWHDTTWFMLPFQFPAFAAGIVCFFVCRNVWPAIESSDERTRRRHRRISWALLAAFVVLWWLMPATNRRYLPITFGSALAFVPLTLALALYENPLLVNGFFTHLGKVSYSVYLIHRAILDPIEHWVSQATIHWHWHPIGQWLLSLACVTLACMALATITYWLIEQPGQVLGRMLIARIERQPLTNALPQTYAVTG